MAPLRLAYMGDPGAFGETACATVDPAAVAVPCPTAETAIAAVRSGDCAAAVLPVHNSVAGPVHAVAALITGSGLDVAGHVDVAITMALLAAPGTILTNVRIVASHPIALAQCSRLIARHGFAAEPAPTTSAAAAALARSPTHDRAVLASARAAAHFGLAVLASDVGDDPRAVTRFAVLERSPAPDPA